MRTHGTSDRGKPIFGDLIFHGWKIYSPPWGGKQLTVSSYGYEDITERVSTGKLYSQSLVMSEERGKYPDDRCEGDVRLQV